MGETLLTSEATHGTESTRIGPASRPALWLLAGALFLLAAVPFLVFSNSLHSPFVGDDLDYIQRNPDVIRFSLPESLALLRPLNKLSYKLDLKVHGGSMPGYHLVNISLHVLAGILLFFLFRKLLRDYAPSGFTAAGPPAASFLAFAGALLYEVHPIHTQAVNYTFARSELFCGVFLFAALLVHAGDRDRKYGPGRALAVSFLFLLALASKERAFMFLPALVLFDLLVRGEESMTVRKRRWRLLVIPVSIVVCLGLVNFFLGFKTQHQGAIGSGMEVPPALPYFWTEMVVRFHYLKLYFWPSDLSFDYLFTLRDRLKDPVLLAAVMGHVVLLAVALLLRRREGRVSFGILWFFLLVLPTSGVVPAALLMHEHWIYIPSFGVFLCVLVSAQHGIRAAARVTASPLPARAIGAVLLGLAVLCAVLSHDRNRVWQNPVSLWTDASRHAANRGWVWNNLAVACLEEHRVDEAMGYLQRAEELMGMTPASALNMGICLMEKGRFEEALERMQTARRLDPERAEIYAALAQLYQRMKKPMKAIDAYLAAFKLGFYSPQLFVEYTRFELSQGNVEKAEKIVAQGRKIFPRNRELIALEEEVAAAGGAGEKNETERGEAVGREGRTEGDGP